MQIKQISEVVWKFYQEGRPNATSQKLSERDIGQFCTMAYGNILRQRRFEDKRMGDMDMLDMVGGSLDIKKYPLSDANIKGMRRAIITDEVVRMPKAQDVINIYPVAEGDCEEAQGEAIPLVQPGEENFYLDGDLDFFQFAVQKGKGINTYNLPPCIKAIEVERIYVEKNLDVPLDIAYDIALSVLGVSLKVQGFSATVDNSFDVNKNQLRYQLEKQEATK